MKKQPIAPLTPSDVERFNSKVVKGPDCWAWTARKDAYGRGMFGLRGRSIRAPRVAWTIQHGRDPEAFVCHTCDNPNCVNPAHLWEGNHKDNAADMCRKGRHGAKPRTHCKRGHPMVEANVYTRPDGAGRNCYECIRLRTRRAKERRKPLDLGVCRDCMTVYADAPNMSFVPVEFITATSVMA